MWWDTPEDRERTQPCDFNEPTVADECTPWPEEYPSYPPDVMQASGWPQVLATITYWRQEYLWFGLAVVLIQCIAVFTPPIMFVLTLSMLTGLHNVPVLGGLLTILTTLIAMGAFNALLDKIIPDAWWCNPW